MTTAAARPWLTHSNALLITIGIAAGLLAVTWAFLNNGSPVAPGIAIWIAWGLYPGLVSIIAVESQSEAAITAVAALVPSLVAAWFIQDGPPIVRFGIPLAIAAGVFFGISVGAGQWRRPGRGRLFGTLFAAGVLGGAVILAIGIPIASLPFI